MRQFEHHNMLSIICMFVGNLKFRARNLANPESALNRSRIG